MNLGPTLSGFLCRQNWSSCPLAPGLVRCYCHKPHMQHVTEGWLSYLCGQPQSIQYKIVNQKPDKSLDWSNRPSWKGGQLGLLVRLASWLNWAGPSNPYTQIGFFLVLCLKPYPLQTLDAYVCVDDWGRMPNGEARGLQRWNGVKSEGDRLPGVPWAHRQGLQDCPQVHHQVGHLRGVQGCDEADLQQQAEEGL